MKEEKKATNDKYTSQEASVDEDTQGYFKRVGDVLEENDFENVEARSLFVENVFTQIDDNEVKLCCDQTISIVMEKLIPFFTTVQVRSVVRNLESFWKVVTMDKFGSHVVQTLVNIVPTTIKTDLSRVKEKERESKDLPSMESIFLKFCSFVEENLQVFIGHVYASHVVRAVLEVLAGVRVSEKVVRSRASREGRPKTSAMEDKKKVGKACPVLLGDAFGSSMATNISQTVPESFYQPLKRITNIVRKMILESLVVHPVSNPVLQTLLLVLHSRDKSLCSKLCKAIMSKAEIFEDGDSDSDTRIPKLFTHAIGSHLVEKVLQVAPPKLHHELFTAHFNDHLVQLSQHNIANYIVQHLLASTTDQEQAEAMIDELLEYIEDILAVGHMGVIIRMAETCARLKVKQKALVTGLLESFHCNGRQEKKSSVPLLVSLTTYDVYYGVKDKQLDSDGSEKEEVKKSESPRLKTINYHGAILLKTLFQFDKPKVFARSLLSLLPEELMTLACDQMGSYTLESFLKSSAVAPKKKHAFVDKMKGNFVKLATDKQGSHVIDTCWKHLEVQDKETITQELIVSEQHLSRNFYGRIILRNCGIEHYKKRSGAWNDREEKVLRKRKMLDEILSEGKEIVATKKSKKPKKANKQEKNEKTFKRKAEDPTSFLYGTELKSLGFDQGMESIKETEEDEFHLQPPPQYFEEEEDVESDDTIDYLFTKGKKQGVSVEQPHAKETKSLVTVDKNTRHNLDFIVSAIEATKPKKKKKKKAQ